jgi:hypothetical protein
MGFREMGASPRDLGDLVEYLVGAAIYDVGSADPARPSAS